MNSNFTPREIGISIIDIHSVLTRKKVSRLCSDILYIAISRMIRHQKREINILSTVSSLVKVTKKEKEKNLLLLVYLKPVKCISLSRSRERERVSEKRASTKT